MTRPPWTLRTDLSEAPIFVCWETTKACLLSCRHCRARAIRKPMAGELSHEQGLKLIDQLTDFREPYPALLFTGGDPLMREDFFELIKYAKDHGIYVAVAASVTPKLNEESISRMKSLGVDIMSVSLDGALPNTHDRLRGIRGTWAATMEALRTAKRAALKAQVNTTVMRSNINELPDIFHLAKENGSVAWEVFFLIRTGRGASLESLEPSECEEVMHFLFDAAQYNVPVRTAEGPHFRRVRAQRMKGGKASEGLIYRTLTERLHALEGAPIGQPSLKMTPTRDGKGLLFVSHDGEVYPSGFLPICTGKVPNETLGSIYRHNPTFLALRNPSSLKGRCGRCEYKEVCGGSRSRAFAEFGDAFQEDPACPYQPSIASPELALTEAIRVS
ncbi:MAG TPA: TIGR04053 family radical SAM/SPASM domain-containing protein [Terriglobales bacterium]|nr:TIGR04053 family radical SAM/SPASM domain-containing protein [Terriglobales bacterium]